MHRTMEDFLAARPFERGPWLAVVFGLGIAGWAVLSGLWQGAGLLALCGAVAVGCIRIDREGDLGHLRSPLSDPCGNAVPLLTPSEPSLRPGF